MRLWRRDRDLGRRGERVAARLLRRSGFRILGRNVVLGRYEIDLIAREGDTVAFVEVKSRRDDALADPEANVTRTKRRHIRKAAHRYIAQHEDPQIYYRFDIVSVLAPEKGKPRATLYRDAFRDDDE